MASDVVQCAAPYLVGNCGNDFRGGIEQSQLCGRGGICAAQAPPPPGNLGAGYEEQRRRRRTVMEL